LFLLETFIKQGDQEAIRFWRRCLLRVKGRAFFLAPNPDLAPEDKRFLLEGTEVLASVFSEVNGTVSAPRLRFRNAWARGVQRLSAWGWDKPTPAHFDLYLLKPGEFREIATRLEQHKIPEDIAPALAAQAGAREPAGPGIWTAAARRLTQVIRSELASIQDSLRAGPNSATDQRSARAPSAYADAKPKNALLDILANVHSSSPPHNGHFRQTELEHDVPHENGGRGISDTLNVEGNRASNASHLSQANGGTNTSSSAPHFDIGNGEVADPNAANGNPNAIMIDSKDIVDNLHDYELAIKVMEGHSAPGYVEGLAAMRRKWQASLEKYGIEAFGQVGEKPDPNSYFIRGSKPSSLPAGEVVEVLRSGYRMHGRLLHEADVIVSEGMGESSSGPD
jgi:hypothetical protein